MLIYLLYCNIIQVEAYDESFVDDGTQRTDAAIYLRYRIQQFMD